MALIFQYGSNMSTERLNSEARLQGDAKYVRNAYTVDDFELDFTVCSKNNRCAAADIVLGSGRKIWGVLYEIPDYLICRDTSGDRRSLDKIEGEGKNYRRIPISLKDIDGQPVEAQTYVVLKERDYELQTSLDYVTHILNGLYKHDMPDEYITYVKQRIINNNPSLGTAIEQFGR